MPLLEVDAGITFSFPRSIVHRQCSTHFRFQDLCAWSVLPVGIINAHSFTVECFEHPHYCCSCALHPQVFDIVYLGAKRPLCFFPFVAVSSGYSAFSFRKQNKEHTKHKTKQKKKKKSELRLAATVETIKSYELLINNVDRSKGVSNHM